MIIIFCRISFSQDILGPTPLKDNPPINLSDHIILGEELSYIASWAGFPAGSIRTKVWNNFKEIDSKKVYLFEATLETNDFVSFFYSVKNTIHSFTEAETGYSRVFIRKINEEDYQSNDRVDYYYNHKDALGDLSPEIAVSVIRNNTIEKLPIRKIPGKLSDPLSFAWLIRGLDFSKLGTRKSILISDRFGTGIVTLTLLSEDKLTIPGFGRFDCYVIKPEASTYESNQNLLKIEGNAKIWVEKNTRIILRAEAESPIGQASAVLTASKKTNLNKFRIDKNNNKEEK